MPEVTYTPSDDIPVNEFELNCTVTDRAGTSVVTVRVSGYHSVLAAMKALNTIGEPHNLAQIAAGFSDDDEDY